MPGRGRHTSTLCPSITPTDTVALLTPVPSHVIGTMPPGVGTWALMWAMSEGWGASLHTAHPGDTGMAPSRSPGMVKEGEAHHG